MCTNEVTCVLCVCLLLIRCSHFHGEGALAKLLVLVQSLRPGGER